MAPPHTIFFIKLLILIATLPVTSSQAIRTFPRLFNTAQDKTVSTTPTGSTCGLIQRTAYCKSSIYEDSVRTCRQAFCEQECPRRTTLPTPTRLLDVSSGLGLCVTEDTINRRPGSSSNAVSFTSGFLCVLNLNNAPNVGDAGAFTLAFWVWIDSQNAGTIVEKYRTVNAEKEIIFSVQLSLSALIFKYKTSQSLRQVSFAENFQLRRWTFITLQVYETIASIFVDGTDLNFAARVTQRLTLPLDDNIGILLIGQDRHSQNQFVGKLQDMMFFDETLANREIDLLYSGTLPSVRIQSSCPCPPNHPRVNPRKTHYCIRNTATDNIADEYMRLRDTAHPLAYLNDGDSNSVWISDFINDVIIDVDLGDQFNIFYLVLQFYSPSPKIVSIYRQTKSDTNWQLWQTYAEDCPTAFGKENNGALTTPNDVNCLQFGTLNLHVPLSKGNITFNLLSSEPIARPGHSDFYNTPPLIDFVKASKVRVRLQGHFYVTAPRHGYFGVYEFIVTGRCDCHGHAETCDTSELPYTCACEANSFTQGKKCDKCQPLYNDKPFKRGNQYEPYACKKCECYGHASSCIYDSSIDLFPDDHDRGGGGVCQQCQHRTTGKQCDTCEELYYRPEGRSLFAENVCEPCECFLAGIQGNSVDCEKIGGNCSCKASVTGRRCDECISGYFNLQASNPAGCEACRCDVKGTIAGAITCDQTQGECICKQNVRGRTCNTCEYGYYNLDENNLLGCTACQCNPLGSTSLYCDPDGGQCPCKTNTEGQFCNVCKDGYYGFESGCVQCACNTKGTEPDSFCDKTTGQCECKKNVMGLKCDQCKDGFYDLDPGLIIGCKECSCNTAGTNPESFICDKVTGNCDCKENVMGRSCGQCKANTFNLTVANEEGCSDCACDISGTLDGDQLAPNDLTCDQNTGKCTCLANRIGTKCDSCDSGYYINSEPGGGCELCDCSSPGTIKETVCDVITGQCQCLQGDYGVSGRRCDSCEPKFYGQDTQTGRCQPCDCDLSGSMNDTCNSASGQCVCKDFTKGRQCGQCIAGTSNLRADNPFGCSKDPSQQPPPSYTHISATALLLEWSAPDYPNGVIQKYNVIRDSNVIAEMGADQFSYTDTGLLPFTIYVYQIEVFNDYGSARSIEMSVRTLAGAPSGNMNIIVSSITSTSAALSWSRPSSANGNIQYYQLQSYNVYNTTVVIHYEGLATSVTVNDLNAYWKYTFFVESCTDGGCLGSERVNFTTRESVPVGQAPPQITPLTSRSLYIKWSPPEKPNGVILFYELHMRGTENENGERDLASRQIFYTSGQYDPLEEFETEKPVLDPPQTNFTITDLQPFTTYEFQVLSQNSLGKAASPWITGRTLEDIPLIMNTPVISAVSSTAINVTWEVPFEIGEARGEIVKYVVYHLVFNDLVLEPFAPPSIWMTVVEVSGNDTFYVVEGFPPYTNQTFKVGACNSIGCVNSSLASGPTDIAAPSGMEAPTVSAHNMSSLSVLWDSPSEPNGPDPYYIVRRTESSFNFPPPAVEPGIRFSGTGYMKFAANTIPQGVAFTGIELWFRTNQEDGLLFFAASEGAQEEFIALQLQASRPWFLYDPQGCMTGVTIEDYEVYNMSDAQWHHFRARRSGKAATITIDEDNGCVTTIGPNGDEGKSYQGSWHHMSVRRKGKKASIVMDSQYGGCASIVTTTDDEGLPYNDNEWHLMRARRRSKSGAIFLDNSWKGCTTFVSVSQEGPSNFADGHWHKLIIRRRYIQTIVSVDDFSGEKVAECATGTIIGENTGVYIGGIPDDYILQRKEADTRAQVTDRNFMGCIRDIRILVQETPEEIWVPLDWGANEEVGGMSSIDAGCPTDLERSYHFLGTGYASYVPDAFNKEPNSVIFEIRTEYTSGLLFFAYGAHGTYYLIQMVSGGLYVELSGPEGRESLVFPNNTNINICDGIWHLIRIDKRGRKLKITLDYIVAREGEGDSSASLSMAITSELYLGGLPPDNDVQSYIKENRLNSYIQGSYGGCMRGLSISRRSYDLAKNYIKLVNVNMDGCPTGTSLRTCTPRESVIVYNGTDYSTANYELQSFTEYMYSVQAVNPAGNSMSPWTIGRTKEGAPFGVTGPQKVKVLSGYRISAQWSTPSGHSGQLTEFILRARSTANMSDFVDAVFEADVFSGEITQAHPYTNYTVSLIACTIGGCTESTDNVQVMTSEEAPQGVYPPIAFERGGDYIVIHWLPPEFVNGILTGYLLYVENNLIYDGGEIMFNLTDLNVYTGYRVYVKACTRKDCTSSSEVVLMTAELPPSYMEPPELTVLDTRRMEVKWTKPRQINGDLQRYLIYVSVTEDDLGEVRYNETDQFEDYTFIDLTPGTLYFIRAAACTGGGCRLSEPSNATTEESAPEGVFAPIVVSPSPSELNVTWVEPEYPNGIIIEYKLYHNGLLVMNSTAIANKFIDGLQPWSLHKFRLAACTARGCGRSEEISARTQESQPLGEVGLEIGEVKSRSVLVRYTGVAVPNGVVYYDIYFDGQFYINADKWNFNTVTDRRSLFTSNEIPPVNPEFVLIDDLVPFSSYSVQVNASNSAGFLISHVEDVNTKQGEPDGVRAPVLTSPTSTSIRAVWQGVERLNSEQEPTYQLQFKELPEDAKVENMFPQATTSMTFLKTGLQPYTSYQFRVIAQNPFGQALSEWSTLITKQDEPAGLDPPMAKDVGARALTLKWISPLKPNGIITTYRIYTQNGLKAVVNANQTEWTLENLEPSSTHTFRIEACTIAGCTLSAQSAKITLMSAEPEGIPAPSVSSTSPTSVIITWNDPQYPNGAISQFGIQRRTLNDTEIILVRTFLPGDPKEYLDQSSVIEPATSYEYRMMVQNSAGKGYGPWAVVTTRSSRPGGVQSPTVNVLTSTSMQISWLPPISSNGKLEMYIVKLPAPRIEINNVSVQSIIIQDLTSFTEYSVTLTACSDGGCTESSPVVIITSPSVPQGQSSPIPIPHSQTFISVTWPGPTQPNGPNIRYELSRLKIRQPLEGTADGFGLWTSIFVGTDRYYEDKTLSLFTTYQYRVTVYNDFGHTTSLASEEVTTFGGTPTKPPIVTTRVEDHTTIEIIWTTPTTEELQGKVNQFIVNVTNPATDEMMSSMQDPDVNDVRVGNLLPNTLYEVTVTIVTHGGAEITSQPSFITTRDGAPTGLDPPYLIVLNRTALRVAWTAPSRPNGQVTSYILHRDGIAMNLNTNQPGSIEMADLEPYRVYIFQIEVCTVYGCVTSDPVQGTTAESVASGIIPPTLTVESSSSLTVIWSAPNNPNGIVLRYELYRRDLLPCSDGVDPNEGSDGKCRYFECGILESFCGDQCYSGPKTCCDGTIYDNKRDYECCGSAYIPKRAQTDYICCGGVFHRPLSNYQCCGQRYVAVNEGEICCPDPYEDRVSVGPGNACCASIPYSTNGAQICCDGELVDGFKKQCCGSLVVSDAYKCCGNSTMGAHYTPTETMSCCGTEYVETAVSACCVNQQGYSKAHLYETSDAKFNANEKCCGLERISAGLDCCNGVGFNGATQTCADISDMEAGCGSGVVCPIANAASAFCDQCGFNQATTKCGSYLPQITHRSYIMTESTSDLCLTEPMKVYQGKLTSYSDNDLKPYTEYQYSVIVVNGAGSASSKYSTAVTAEALPEGLDSLKADVEEGQLDTIYLSWQEPEEPNGIILWYMLLRDGVEIFRHPTQMQYKDENAIQPYQTYRYKLKACNSVGCVENSEIEVATLQSRPEQFFPPVITVETSTSVTLMWETPSKPNGYIIEYIIYEENIGVVVNVTGSARQYTTQSLSPYTQYTFWIAACTEAGCTNSSAKTVRTSADKPLGLRQPYLIVTSSTSAEISWDSPAEPNGLIIGYKIHRSTNDGEFMPISQVLDTVHRYTDNGVMPNTRYAYKIEAYNIAGSVTSSAITVTMPTSTPSGISAPTNVTVLGPYSIYVQWIEPSQPNGVIDSYKILLNAGTIEQREKGVGLAFDGEFTGLLPYTEYTVRIQACLDGIPNGCGVGPGTSVTTHEAPPEGQQQPELVALTSTSIMVVWEPPTSPNGVLTQFRIHRRNSGSSGRGNIINVVSGEVLSVTNTAAELQPYTVYEYMVTAVNSKGSTTSDWAEVRTLAAAPQVLNSPLVELISAYSLTISWAPPISPNGIITEYRLEYEVVSEDPTIPTLTHSVSVSGDVLETSISGLQPYTAHRVRVVAINTAGSLTSQWRLTTTAQASPSGVGPFTVEKVTDGQSVILRWSQPAYSNGIVKAYLVYEEDNVNPVYQGLTREFEYRRLQPYTQYKIQLEACTDGGCTKSSLQAFFTAEVNPSDQPAPSTGSVNATHATLTWSKPINSNGEILRYDVLRRNDGRIVKRDTTPDGQIVYSTTNTDSDSFAYTDSGLDPYTHYLYAIQATNAVGSTQSPWQSVETKQAAPSGISPPIVSQIAGSSDKLLIRWTAPTRSNGVIRDYQLQRNDTIPLRFAPTDPKTYTDSGLTAHTVYAYTLTVCSGGGCTTSLPTVIQTSETAPFYVAAPSVNTIDSTSISVSWNEPQVTNGRIQVYHLQVDGTTIYSGQNLEYLVTNLVPYQAYAFSIQACTYGGCTESSSVVGRPLAASPTNLARPTLRVTGSSSIEISWSPPSNPNGVITAYEVYRGDELITTTTTRLLFTDYDVEPGKTYSYKIIAYNSRGSVESPANAATTYASAPAGLAAPSLEALSSSTVRAQWSEPTHPNGVIHNYTLYKNSDDIVYSERGLTTIVRQLKPWTTFSFRVEACTTNGCTLSESSSIRTLEAPPEGMAVPTLTAIANAFGAMESVFIQWTSPLNPNGIIIKYELYRREYTGSRDNVAGITEKLLFSGLDLTYTDQDPELKPYTHYEYKILSANSEGSVQSQWGSVLTKEAPPEGVPAPTVEYTTADTIRLTIQEPEQPNGYITRYNVYLNGTLVEAGTATSIDIETLSPYSVYIIYVEACTAGGCTTGVSVATTTQGDIPEGMGPLQVTNIARESFDVGWSQPSTPNGIVVRYEVHMRQSCPHPYADNDDEVSMACEEGPWTEVANALVNQVTIENLMPYTRYECKVNAINEIGGLESPPVVSAVTLSAPPVYITSNPPKLQPTGNIVEVNWGHCFRINGEVNQFVLSKDGQTEYSGPATTFNVYRNSRYEVYEFKVTLYTNQGEAETPTLIFDPSKPDYVAIVGTSEATTFGPTEEAVRAASLPVYQEVWFIVVVAILALVLLFIGIALCLRCSGHRMPYIRERAPLQPRQRKAVEGMPYFDGNFISSEIAPQSQYAPSMHSAGVGALPHVGYVNPAYSHLAVPMSQSASMVDLHMDKVSHKSIPWEDDEDAWDGPIAYGGTDSGLHSLAYGDDYDAASDQPISVLKEHTMFSDTHL